MGGNFLTKQTVTALEMWSKPLCKVFTGPLRHLHGCCTQNLMQEGHKSQKELVQVRQLWKEPHEGHIRRGSRPGCGHPLPLGPAHIFSSTQQTLSGNSGVSWRSSRVTNLIRGLGNTPVLANSGCQQGVLHGGQEGSCWRPWAGSGFKRGEPRGRTESRSIA